MDIGKLVYTYKGKRYIETSNITHKALYKVIYKVFFYKNDEPIMDNFLKEYTKT